MTKRANTCLDAGPRPRWLIARRLVLILLVATLVVPSAAAPTFTIAQSNLDEELGPPDADVNCPNFLSQADAQAVYDAAFESDERDVYELDRPNPNGQACDSDNARDDFGTEDLASCANFRQQSHAQALFDAGGAGDPYNLDPNGNGDACDLANFGDGSDDVADDDVGDEDLADDEPLDEPLDTEPIPSDLPPSFSPGPEPAADLPDAEGCDVDIQAGRAYVITDCDDGTVDAGHLPFEGFDDFAERAQNGFGAFDDTSSFAAPAVETQQSTAPADVEMQQSLPDPASDDELPATNNDTRATRSEQPARQETVEANQKRTAKQRAKARLAKKRANAKRAKQKQLKLKRAKQRRARLQAARAAKQREEQQSHGERNQQQSSPRR